MKISLIIAAAGTGSRFGSPTNKILLPLAGKPLILHSIELFDSCPQVEEIIIACAACDISQITALSSGFAKVKAVVKGGDSRSLSIARALAHCGQDCSHIAVHDAARPLLTAADWQALLQEAATAAEGVILAAEPTDSIRYHQQGRISAILDRSKLLLAQTPQIFPAALLRRAYLELDPQIIAQATDEAELIAALGKQPRFVISRDANFKITRSSDLALAEALWQQHLGAGALRYGLGWDSHRLQAGRPLILGGIHIPYHQGLLGHSDADVLIHAIIDALLGAASLGDIGRHFPDTDPAYLDIASGILLGKTQELLSEQGWSISHIDATVIAEQPRLAAYHQAMAANLASILGIEAEQISLKAKTNEGLGNIGREKAMAALAIATIRGSYEEKL